MIEPGNIEDLFAKIIVVGGPIASIALAWCFADNRNEFVVYLLVGLSITGMVWAKFHWWTH